MKLWEEWKNRAEAAEARVEMLETMYEPLTERTGELVKELSRMESMYEEERAALGTLRTNVLRHIEAAKEVCVDSYHQQSQREYEGQPKFLKLYPEEPTLHQTASALRDYLLEPDNPGIIALDIPDNIWNPFNQALDKETP